MSDLAGLIERVREAKGPSREIDAMIAAAVARQPVRYVEDDDATYMVDGNNEYVAIERVTSSIDAALGLVERLLPGQWPLILDTATSTMWATEAEVEFSGSRIKLERLPLAILLALLTSLSEDTTHAK